MISESDRLMIQRLQAENEQLIKEVDRLREASDQVLVEAGFYSFSHRLDTAAAYKAKLAQVQEEVKLAIRSGEAIESAEGFIFNNSLAKGKKMIADLSKLMLRAYNAEAENCVRTVRANSLNAAVKRLERAATSIEKQGSMMQMKISDAYHELRLDELRLTVDFLMKLEEEKEAAREERARLREERRVEQELAKQREKLEKEKAHYLNVLAALPEGSPDRSEIESSLRQVGESIEANDYRSANVRAGYVYVISNLGAFGPTMMKIGMTRRLEPMDRVYELGDASVPFGFDVHALFFSEDAISVEAELHRRFAHKRVNRINLRREFFYATPEEVKIELELIQGSLLEYTVEPVAEQYYLSRSAQHNEENANAMG